MRLHTILFRSHPDMFFEILTKKRRRRKIKIIGNLLNRELGGFQQGFGIADH